VRPLTQSLVSGPLSFEGVESISIAGALPPPLDPRIAACAAGDRLAAQALLTELLPRIRNVIRYMIRNDADVDDLAQEAMIVVLRALASFRNEGRFESWVDRVVVRVCLLALRRKRRDRERLESIAPAEIMPAGSFDPDFLAHRRVVGLLDELPLEQRHALVLHHVLGLSVPEVADEIDSPVETVRSRLRLGRTRLRDLWGGEPQTLEQEQT